jgi:predicted nucleotidyltransferase
MTINNQLESLLPPEKARVLGVLERAGQPLSGRMIAALTETVSQPTVSRQLLRLCELGLVAKVPGGYEINRDHVAYRALEALLDARVEIQRRIVAHVASWSTSPLSVILFGSGARGDDSSGSDVDLLIVRPDSVPFDDLQWVTAVADLSERVTRWSGAPCEVLEYSRDELAELERASDSPPDSQAGIILHELSHFPDCGATNDYFYGPTKCAQLAQTNPGKALGNADSFEYFMEEF